jgi:hypothetical protein
MTKLKTKIIQVGLGLTGLIGNVSAAANDSFNPDLAQGQQNLMSLQYADKAKWILDTLYAFINWAAIAALLILVAKFLLGGWDSIEAEIRSRRAMMMIILVIIGLKIGLMIINLVLSW